MQGALRMGLEMLNKSSPMTVVEAVMNMVAEEPR